MQLDQILRVAVKGNVSDVVLKVGVVPRFRYQNELVSVSDGKVITPELMEQWVLQVLPEHHKKNVNIKELADCDCAYQLPEGNRFRVNILRQKQNLGMVLRVIQNRIKTLEELHMPEVVTKLTEEKRGLVIVTGATGSGKSTTLAAMIDRINGMRSDHIVTIEDPIEFVFNDKKSTINQREVGLDTESFAKALRAALRQNPDVIFVGELRDRETTETALMAAETGHLVFSTLHTADAVESLTRMMSYFPPHQHTALRMMIAGCLKAVISQRLVVKKDNKGRIAAVEIMIANAFVRENILEGANFLPLYEAIKSGGETYGTQSFDQSLLKLYYDGMITMEEALKQASNRDDMDLQMRGIGA